MFGISFGELIIIGLVSVLVIDPKEMPGIVFNVKKFLRHIKNEVHLLKTSSKDIVDDIEKHIVGKDSVYDVQEACRYDQSRNTISVEQKDKTKECR